jgi:hypothetical protein
MLLDAFSGAYKEHIKEKKKRGCKLLFRLLFILRDAFFLLKCACALVTLRRKEGCNVAGDQVCPDQWLDRRMLPLFQQV